MWRLGFVVLLYALVSPGSSEVQFLPGDSSKLQYSGRMIRSGPNVLWEWVGVKMATQINCPSQLDAAIQFHIQPPAKFTKTWPLEESETYLVLIDGTRAASFQTHLGTNVYNVTLPSLKSGTHLLELLKNTERQSIAVSWSYSEGQGATTFSGIGIPAGCSSQAPPVRSSRRLEFIGDSITCGFGNLAKSTIDHIKCVAPPSGWQEYEDFELASASLASKEFRAELHTECISGVGITRNGATLARTTAYNMSHYVHRALPTLPIPWDYSSWTPHLAVVNLGTNDYDIAEKVGIQPSFDSFEAAYLVFLQDYVNRYSGRLPAIVVACGPMTKTQCPTVQKAAASLQSTFPSLKVQYVDLSLDHCDGCASHPDVHGDQLMADQLRPVISKLTGWSLPSKPILV